MRDLKQCVAFEGDREIAFGELLGVALKAKESLERGERAPILIFDAVTSELVEVDFRGTADDVAGRLAGKPVDRNGPVEARGPGRPKLGVVGREVTLLPRHWEWLGEQPGGASVALRKLVEAARRENEGADQARKAREAAYRFINAMAGNLPGFEEAARILFSTRPNRIEEFERQVAGWPEDVRRHAVRLARDA